MSQLESIGWRKIPMTDEFGCLQMVVHCFIQFSHKMTICGNHKSVKNILNAFEWVIIQNGRFHHSIHHSAVNFTVYYPSFLQALQVELGVKWVNRDLKETFKIMSDSCQRCIILWLDTYLDASSITSIPVYFLTVKVKHHATIWVEFTHYFPSFVQIWKLLMTYLFGWLRSLSKHLEAFTDAKLVSATFTFEY